MKRLRNLSPRPELLVDARGKAVIDIATPGQIGLPGPLGRGRIVSALPTNKSGPQKIADPIALHDNRTAYLADPDGNLVGEANAVWISRLLTATITHDTRRL